MTTLEPVQIDKSKMGPRIKSEGDNEEMREHYCAASGNARPSRRSAVCVSTGPWVAVMSV